MPPALLTVTDGAMLEPAFEPAPDLLAWLLATFVEEGAPLRNQDHEHLVMARIGCLWTNVGNFRHGRRVVGQCEFRPPGGTMGKWARARAEAQLYGWFGEVMPLDFLLTFDAEYVARASDDEWCALAEHELYHCGQARDEFGAPKFRGETGLPVFCMRGHDVEEFVGVVKRYGAISPEVAALIEATADVPALSIEAIRGACGTCKG